MRLCQLEGCDLDLDELGKAPHARFCSREHQVAGLGTRTSTSSGRRQLMVRIPDDLRETLREEADARMVSVTWLVTKLLREGVAAMTPAEEFTLVSRRKTESPSS